MSSKIYTLGYTGAEVDEAIGKIQNLDITSLSGGIIELESTQDTPYNLDFLRVVGLYKAAYVYEKTAPSGVGSITPVYIYVSSSHDEATDTDMLIQTLHAGNANYTRVSTSEGQTWEVWEAKDGLESAMEITPEEVDAIFAEVLGTDDSSETEIAYTLLTTSQSVSAQSTTSKTTSAATSVTAKSVAF